jgi:hypothetical protein
LSYLSGGRSFALVWFDLVVVRCGDQYFELEVDVEVSVERITHCAGLERSANVFSTAVASWNGVGCVGCSSLHELTMSCNYISLVVVVTCIVMNVEFL